MSELVVRRATSADAPIIGQHRTSMFIETGRLDPGAAEALTRATVDFLSRALADGSFVGWVVTPEGRPDAVVGGIGVQVRPLLPRPGEKRGAIESGQQALIHYMYVAPSARQRGLARRLISTILKWVREEGITTVVLHASEEGRPLYEQMGFVATNEMRYAGRREL